MASMLERFGFYIFPWGKNSPTVESLVDLARHGEELGFDSVHLPYHLTLPTTWIFPDFGNREIIDPLVALPAIIQGTERIRVSLNTAVLPLLNPYVWAKYLATCDHLAKGRFIAGVAIGWWEEEFRIVEAPLSRRGRMTDEALEVMTRLWTEDAVTFEGQFYRLDNVGLEPKPYQQPYPPVLVGGGLASAERAAKYGTYLMPLTPTPATVRDVIKPRLTELAERHGRDVKLATMNYTVVSDDADWVAREVYPILQRCVGGSRADPVRPEDVAIYGNPEQCAERARALLDAGVDYIIFDFQYHGLETEDFAREHMRRFVEEVVPFLA
ncbi:MAG: Luciferase-like, subgroup [Thermomicrobiales bacterium]|nr:Luciferase-like, subgroup [Thermomicrobiales bacterium]MDF3040266.1 Luciferase-like, subgroup [Thermomicrobiales bacterium]